MNKQNKNGKNKANLEEMVKSGSQIVLLREDGSEQPIEEIINDQQHVVDDPFAGEFPVGQNPTLAGELAAGSGAGLSAGELALGSAPSLGSSEEFTPAPPVGGESPVGVSRGATQ